jgi:predicted Zn-dependent peptidase
LVQPIFPTDALEKLRAIYIQGYERRKDSNTDVAIRMLKNIIYKDHPYSWTFDEAIGMIRNADVKTVRALHTRFVNPSNMILTVVGDFDLVDMKKNIETIFDDWEKGACYKATYPKVDFDAQEKIDRFMLRDQVVLVFGRPSPLNLYDKDLVPVRILNFIAFDSLGSRIYQLRERTGLFYMATGSFAAAATREHGYDYVGSMLTIDTLEQAEKQILDVIDQVGKKGVTTAELNDARQMYLKALIDLTSSNEAIASMFSLLESFDLGFDYYDKVLKRVQTISLDEINKIAAKYFVSKGMARVRVGRVGKKIK